MKNRSLMFGLSMFVAMTVVAAADTAPTLMIGDAAPQLKVMKWLQGTPVSKFEKGHVYVVEFWATWCGPCRDAMPHLSELAKKYAGKVSFIGVDSIEKSATLNPAFVQKFVDNKNNHMEYLVAMDDPAKNLTYKAWMKASGMDGIPTAFIVDGRGIVVWIGSPRHFERDIKDAIAGTSDIEGGRAEQVSSIREAASARREENLFKPIYAAMQAKDHPAALAAENQAIKEDPSLERKVYQLKIQTLFHLNMQEGFKYLDSKANDAEFLKNLDVVGRVGFLESVAKGLAVQEDDFPKPVYKFIAPHLESAIAKDPKDAFLPYYLQALARVDFRLGDVGKAIDAQQKAITALTKRGGSEYAQYIAEFKEGLASYQATAKAKAS